MLAVLTDAIELVLRDGSALDARRAILRRRAAEPRRGIDRLQRLRMGVLLRQHL